MTFAQMSKTTMDISMELILCMFLCPKFTAACHSGLAVHIYFYQEPSFMITMLRGIIDAVEDFSMLKVLDFFAPYGKNNVDSFCSLTQTLRKMLQPASRHQCLGLSISDANTNVITPRFCLVDGSAFLRVYYKHSIIISVPSDRSQTEKKFPVLIKANVSYTKTFVYAPIFKIQLIIIEPGK